MKQGTLKKSQQDIDLACYRYVSIISSMPLKEKTISKSEICSALKISEKQAENSIKRLNSNGIITKKAPINVAKTFRRKRSH